MSNVKLCKTSGETLNTGSTKQCIEGKIVKVALAKSDFAFDSVADALNQTKWTEAITAKNIVPLYELHEVANANTEASFFESGSFRFQTAKAVKKVTFESYLGLCSHKALKSYQDSEYTRVFGITEDGAIIGVMDGLKVKGEELSDFNVAIRNSTVKDKPATTVVTMTYKDYEELENNPFAQVPDWDVPDLNGIFNIDFELVSASATEVVVKATSGCDNTAVSGLLLTDFAYTGGTLSAVTESSGTYTFTGTGLTSGTFGTDGVVTLGSSLYEGVNLAITI